MEILGTSAIAVIAIGLSTLSLWGSWLVGLRKPNSADVENFRNLRFRVVSCEQDLAIWVDQRLDLKGSEALQLEALLLNFKILCDHLDDLKVWTPSTAIDDF